MKCNRCPYRNYDTCLAPEEKMTVWKDGQDGCTLTRRQLDKMDAEYADYLGDVGEDMGISMDFDNKGWQLDDALDHMRHMIGLDMLQNRPYKRHSKLYYKPYRNYWDGYDKYLDYFSGALGLVDKRESGRDGEPYYKLTRRGLDFLGRHIGVTIYDERD